MQRLKVNVSERQVNGALHQFEGIIVETESGEQYSFVPILALHRVKGVHLRTAGTVTPIQNGQFGDPEAGAELYLRNPNTDDAFTELEVLNI